MIRNAMGKRRPSRPWSPTLFSITTAASRPVPPASSRRNTSRHRPACTTCTTSPRRPTIRTCLARPLLSNSTADSAPAWPEPCQVTADRQRRPHLSRHHCTTDPPLRQEHDIPLPLVLMNSFRTDADSKSRPGATTRDSLRHRRPSISASRKHKVPKLLASDLTPAAWPNDPELAWCPPGHGDLYTALVTSGALASMRSQGYRYAFISNADNLGATLDPNHPGAPSLPASRRL